MSTPHDNPTTTPSGAAQPGPAATSALAPGGATSAPRSTHRAPYAGNPLPRVRESAGFLASIEGNWGTEPCPTGVPDGAAASAEGHRRQLSAAFPGRTIVVAAGVAPVRNDDCFYAFRPDSAFVWLTACQAEGAVLVMEPAAGGHDAVLYLPPPFRPGDAGFFSDPNHGELWAGPLPGLEQWQADLDIEVRPLSHLDGRSFAEALASRAAGAVVDGVVASQELERELSNLRMVKDEWEIGQLRAAVDATIGGFGAVAAEMPRAIADGLGEQWLQATFDRHARTFGNGPGYSTIVGSAHHAPILHWVRCDGPIDPDRAVLLDMGVETRTLYTADVTRTVPAGDSFTAAERQVHDLVEKAHRVALDAVVPGGLHGDFHFASMEVLAQGLADWGLLPVSVDEALAPNGQHHRRYICCGVGHHLGLDVHDCSQSMPTEYALGELVPGMVTAVEPGLYFHRTDLTVPPELRGVGIRIEDDVLITRTGHEVLSAALPIDADGLEQWARAQRA